HFVFELDWTSFGPKSNSPLLGIGQVPMPTLIVGGKELIIGIRFSVVEDNMVGNFELGWFDRRILRSLERNTSYWVFGKNIKCSKKGAINYHWNFVRR
ncbi:8963_t:CDS:2, partial [Funneliformis mosseae]